MEEVGDGAPVGHAGQLLGHGVLEYHTQLEVLDHVEAPGEATERPNGHGEPGGDDGGGKRWGGRDEGEEMRGKRRGRVARGKKCSAAN